MSIKVIRGRDVKPGHRIWWGDRLVPVKSVRLLASYLFLSIRDEFTGKAVHPEEGVAVEILEVEE